MMKRFLLTALLALFASSAWSASTDAALLLAKDTTERMQVALKQNRAMLEREPSKIYGLVDQVVLPHFDFATIARWVMGKYWRQASAEQRERFTEEFRTLLVRTYAKALLEYADAEIRFLPVSGSGDDITVRSEVDPGDGGPKVPIHYQMHAKSGDWKVYDVTVDGISLVANYRGSIASQIRQEGLEAVIAKIRERNQSGR